MRALVIVDVQRAIDDPIWSSEGERNNRGAERNIARLLVKWRERGWPVYHVRHDSVFPDSTYRPGQPGNEFKPECAPAEGEPVIVSTVLIEDACFTFPRRDCSGTLRSADEVHAMSLANLNGEYCRVTTAAEILK